MVNLDPHFIENLFTQQIINLTKKTVGDKI
jgi:hypothetical protein